MSFTPPSLAHVFYATFLGTFLLCRLPWHVSFMPPSLARFFYATFLGTFLLCRLPWHVFLLWFLHPIPLFLTGPAGREGGNTCAVDSEQSWRKVITVCKNMYKLTFSHACLHTLMTFSNVCRHTQMTFSHVCCHTLMTFSHVSHHIH